MKFQLQVPIVWSNFNAIYCFFCVEIDSKIDQAVNEEILRTAEAMAKIGKDLGWYVFLSTQKLPLFRPWFDTWSSHTNDMKRIKNIFKLFSKADHSSSQLEPPPPEVKTPQTPYEKSRMITPEIMAKARKKVEAEERKRRGPPVVFLPND